MTESFKYYAFGNVIVRQADNSREVQSYTWSTRRWRDESYSSYRGKLAGFGGEAGTSYEEITQEEAEKLMARREPKYDKGESVEDFLRQIRGLSR